MGWGLGGSRARAGRGFFLAPYYWQKGKRRTPLWRQSHFRFQEALRLLKTFKTGGLLDSPGEANMQLQFTELGGEPEPMPAMAPFAMRNEGLVYNRGTTRGSGVLESTAPAAPVAHAQPKPVVHVNAAPPNLPHQCAAPAAPTPCAPPTQCPTHTPCAAPAAPTPCAPCPSAIGNAGLPPWLVYALLIANVVTIVMCLALVTRRK
jgi:hypothetical protein